MANPVSGDDQLAVEIRFLAGRFVATSHNDRRVAEWPPHPARVFSALVAAWAEVEVPDSDEREALEWLERQEPPAITASEAVPRRTVSHFVPVNDASVVSRSLQERRAATVNETSDQLDEALVASGGDVTPAVRKLQKRLAKARDVAAPTGSAGKTPNEAAVAMLPEGRWKQERAFPSMVPDDPCVHYTWTDRPAAQTVRALDRLLERVTRLGHSSSLVSCRVAPGAPEPTLVVAADGRGTLLRAIRRGQLAELDRQFARHRGHLPRALPYTGVRYQSVQVSSAKRLCESNTAGEWIVFEFAHDCRAFPVTRSVEIATAMRAAIMAYADDPIPGGITGHRRDGRPALAPHMATLPIPHVGSAHADGRLLGIALSVPKSMDEVSRNALYRAIGKWERVVAESAGHGQVDLTLTMGTRGECRLRRVVGVSELVSLRTTVWHRSSRRWMSATPVALPRHPGPLTRGSPEVRSKAWARAEASVRLACEHVGLPEPSEVKLSLDPWISGARKAIHFPAFRQAGRDGGPVRRQLLHASVTFDERVRGPLMLGAGRFFGLGLMRPVPERSPRADEEEGDG